MNTNTGPSLTDHQVHHLSNGTFNCVLLSLSSLINSISLCSSSSFRCSLLFILFRNSPKKNDSRNVPRRLSAFFSLQRSENPLLSKGKSLVDTRSRRFSLCFALSPSPRPSYRIPTVSVMIGVVVNVTCCAKTLTTKKRKRKKEKKVKEKRCNGAKEKETKNIK